MAKIDNTSRPVFQSISHVPESLFTWRPEDPDPGRFQNLVFICPWKNPSLEFRSLAICKASPCGFYFMSAVMRDYILHLKSHTKSYEIHDAFTSSDCWNHSDPLKFNPGRIGEIAKASGWPRNKLWHEACDEGLLEDLFLKNGVYT